MARRKIPGIYMIRNKTNGRIYIGSSSDVRKRYRQYQWAALSTKSYNTTKVPVVQAMRNEGLENFTFTVLEYGGSLYDTDTRLMRESELIAQYRATDPDIGYNVSSGMEYLAAGGFSRLQEINEVLRRASPIVEYDYDTKRMVEYLGGAKQWGEEQGIYIPKDIASHIVQRGMLYNVRDPEDPNPDPRQKRILRRVFLIPADKKIRDELYQKVKQERIYNIKGLRQTSITRKRNSFAKFEEAYQAVDRETWLVRKNMIR